MNMIYESLHIKLNLVRFLLVPLLILKLKKIFIFILWMIKTRFLVNMKLKEREEQIMNKKLIKILFIVCLSYIFAISSAFAQGKGKEHNKNRPPGWEEGEKKGWQSDVPPGQEKKDEKLKKKTNKSENNQGKKSKSKAEQEAEENESEDKGEKVKQKAEKESETKVKETELKKEEREAKSKTKKEKSKAMSKQKKSK